MKKTLLFLVVIALSAVAAAAQDDDMKYEPLTSAVSYSKTVTDKIAKSGGPDLIFADVGDYNTAEKPVWKKFKTEAEFEESRETEESYTIAYVWLRDGKPVAVNFTYSSPSGDWAQYVEHVFREDGSAAMIRKELRTFLGDLIVIRTSWFDNKGVWLKKTQEFFDLESKKPVEATESFQDVEVDVYMKAGELPFSLNIEQGPRTKEH